MSQVELRFITPNYMDALKLAASQSYQTQATDKVIDHIIKAGHLSVLEHCSATFEIKASISVLLQITRHRHLSFTVQSSRGSVLTELHKTGNSIIDNTNERVLAQYRALVNAGVAREDAAYILPKAAEYNFVVTGNFRAWYEYLGLRLCKRALPEHRDIAKAIHNILKSKAPEVFDRDVMHCKTCSESSCGFAK